MTTEAQAAPTADTTNEKPGRAAATRGKPRTISNPNDVASLVLMQIDQVNSKKDDLTIAVKSLADTAKQLVRTYAEQTTVIAKLQQRVKALEEKPDAGNNTVN
jgi:hypothetical protein